MKPRKTQKNSSEILLKPLTNEIARKTTHYLLKSLAPNLVVKYLKSRFFCHLSVKQSSLKEVLFIVFFLINGVSSDFSVAETGNLWRRRRFLALHLPTRDADAGAVCLSWTQIDAAIAGRYPFLFCFFFVFFRSRFIFPAPPSFFFTGLRRAFPSFRAPRRSIRLK